ncbi:MAG: hypothetical protein AAFX94_23040 [Myxococcota bacterium]
MKRTIITTAVFAVSTGCAGLGQPNNLPQVKEALNTRPPPISVPPADFPTEQLTAGERVFTVPVGYKLESVKPSNTATFYSVETRLERSNLKHSATLSVFPPNETATEAQVVGMASLYPVKEEWNARKTELPGAKNAFYSTRFLIVAEGVATTGFSAATGIQHGADNLYVSCVTLSVGPMSVEAFVEAEQECMRLSMALSSSPG